MITSQSQIEWRIVFECEVFVRMIKRGSESLKELAIFLSCDACAHRKHIWITCFPFTHSCVCLYIHSIVWRCLVCTNYSFQRQLRDHFYSSNNACMYFITILRDYKYFIPTSFHLLDTFFLVDCKLPFYLYNWFAGTKKMWSGNCVLE